MNASGSDERDARDMLRLVAGEEDALNDLMGRHAGPLYRHLMRCVHNEEDAAEIAQETFVRLYRSRARYDSRLRFAGWLYTIAANLVRDCYRWRTRHPQVSLDDLDEVGGETGRVDLREDRASPADALQCSERSEAVRLAIAALPVELRLPLVLSVYEERSHAEIGAILGCSAKAVETRIYRARMQLRDRLGNWLARV